VLDRPDPLDGVHVEGPPLAGTATRSFVNHAPLAVRHGMTMGELALLFDATAHLGTTLDVVRAAGWSRGFAWRETGLPWVPPSPNLRTPTEALLYSGVALLEATNLSVGRGTPTPFELVGAPWIDGGALAAAVAKVAPRGVRVARAAFTPVSSRFAGQPCEGISLAVTDPAALAPVTLGIAIATALRALYPSRWEVAKLGPLLAFPPAQAAIERGLAVPDVEATWATSLRAFEATRAKYLLYPTAACP
jgi:uncharacterized protein YbbC (DUF1343 family)